MSFSLVYTNLAGPLGNINVSSDLTAEAGMIGYIAANATTGDPEVKLANSGTTGLIGIIDDNKTSSFTATVVNEVVVSGQTALAHANLVDDTVSLSNPGGSGSVSVTSQTNGTITVADIDPNDTSCTVSYGYIIPGKAGDDTTLASGRCTIWLAEGEYATDVYEVASGVAASTYTVGTLLYVADDTYGQQGRLTTRTIGAQAVGRVTKAPTAGNPVMNFFKTGV